MNTTPRALPLFVVLCLPPRSIEGLECCPQLRRLVLTSNRVARVEGLAACTALEHLALQVGG